MFTGGYLCVTSHLRHFNVVIYSVPITSYYHIGYSTKLSQIFWVSIFFVWVNGYFSYIAW